MQNLSHRIFNGTLAAHVIASFYQKHLSESIIFACGLILFSSFPDNIEKFGLKHRGVSHSLLLYVLIAIIVLSCLCIFPQSHWICVICLAFIAGCVGHILADMFSKNGIKVLGYPLRANFYRTGKISEQVFLFGFVLLNIALILLCLR